MFGKLTRFSAFAWRGAILLLTLEVVAVSVMRYLTHDQAAPDIILENVYAKPFLILHVLGGTTALLLGPLQFVARVRNRFPALHRASGRTYAAACAIGAPAGFMLALGTRAGPVASLGFAVPAVLWPIFTFVGIRLAITGRLSEHREWMLRSYAITANAVTLRIMLPFAGLVLGLPFTSAYPVIAWLGWMVNLAAAELYLRRNRKDAIAQPRLAIA